MGTAVLFLVLAAFVIRLYTGSDLYLHAWDERYHALVAKHFLAHPLKPVLYEHPLLDYQVNNWSANHIWLCKPAVPLWLAAASIRILGTTELAVRMPAILFSSLSVLLTYCIGAAVKDRKTGLIAAFLHAINGLLIEVCAARVSSDIVETVFLFFTEFSMLCAIYASRRTRLSYWTGLCGLGIAGAFLSKWIAAFIIIPLCFLPVLFSGPGSTRMALKQMLLILIVALVPSAIWCSYLFYHFPVEAGNIYSSLLFPVSHIVQEHKGSVFYYTEQLRIQFGEIIYLPVIWYIWRLIRGVFNANRFLLSAWLLIPLLLLSLCATKRATYLLITAPAVFIIAADFFTQLRETKVSGYRHWLKITILILLIALPVRYCIERVKPFAPKEDRAPAWAQQLKSLPEKRDSTIVLFNYRATIEAMFYTDFAAVYGYIPDIAKIKELQRQGYHIWINDDGHLAPELYRLPGICFRNLIPPPQ